MRRIIFSIAIFLFSLASVMGQKIPINLPADGNWPTIVGDSIMIIGPLQNELTEEQRYFNPIYLMVYPGKEHLAAQIIRAGLCDCDLTKPNRRIGVFSVAPDKQVSFSQGNLQYLPAINLWKFANTQYEYLGNANKYLKPTFRNWVDLFGWSANNTTAPFGVSTSMSASDYAGDFVDWGTNTICGDAKDTWRTLSIEEWEYIYHGRKNADQLLAIATLEGVPGLILLPDNWQQPEDIPFVSSVEQGLAWDATRVEGSYFDTSNKDHTKDNIYTQAQWQKMEALGAVFLPCAGWRQEKTWTHAGIVEVNIKYLGSYWSCSTPQISNDYYFFRFTQQEIRKFPLNNSLSLLARGRSVRLVHDTIVPETIPEPNITFEVNGVQYKMIYVEGGNFMMGSAEDDEVVNQNLAAMGDELPQHKVTLDSYYIGEIEVTQKLWKDIMGTDVYDLYRNLTHQGPEPNVVGDNYPIYYMYTSDMIEFTRKLSKVTGLNFRLPTEAEWEYAARGGNKSKGYLYAGSNNVDDVAWYNGNTNNKGVQLVAQKLPNELGIYDMSGNVLEHCLDYLEYHEPYSVEAVHNPRGRISQYGNRAYRGGSWNMHKDSVRVTHRAPQIPTFTSTNVGARLVINDNHHFQTFCVNNVWFDMIFVKGDSSLSDYYIGQIEVTQALWRAVMGNAPGTFQDKNLPVDKVSWNDCQVFIHKLNQLTGYHFRLPTEAEWEYAARGGEKSKGYEYAGSDMIGDVAWYQGNSNNAIHTFAKKLPNELGIYDMSGNVWEWCEDCVNTDENMHVVKSGSFYDLASTCRIDFRTARLADYKSYIGLRLVLDDTALTPPEPEYVDLGLSVKWATFNVGATSSEDYGDYFAWGETEPKETYSWATYKWCDGTQNTMTKYNATDGKTILEPEDDAAHVHWGDKWRMPTYEEQMELIEKCSWERTNLNGVIGYKVTGPNGNSIFIPIAGAYNSFDDQLNSVGSIGWIYSSTIATEIRAYEIHIEEGIIQQKDCSRCVGLTIRPVYDDRPPKRIGVFSVAADKQVSFSQGNLQYIQSTKTWQFVANQLEYMGHKHYRNGQLADTIEYFGWSGKNSKVPWGISLSTESSDYAGEFLDWGTNTIAGSAPNTWRTLSNDEWLYICQGRKSADQLLGLGTIGTVTGLIILPDDWQLPKDLSFTPNTDDAAKNQYTYEQWAKIESEGAVFIATCGYFNHKLGGMRHIGGEGHIRTNALSDRGLQIYTVVKTDKIIYSYSGTQQQNLHYAFAQRLVHDTILPVHEPEYVDLGLSVKWATFNVGATSPEDYGDYFAWGER